MAARFPWSTLTTALISPKRLSVTSIARIRQLPQFRTHNFRSPGAGNLSLAPARLDQQMIMRSYCSLIFSAILVVASGVSAIAQRPAAPAGQRPAAPAGQRPATPAPQTPTPSASANATLPVSKMAVIYSEAFLDTKTGIAKFNMAITRLNGEFQKQKDELTQMQTRAQQLQDEVSKLQNAPAGTPIDQRTVQAKAEQLDQLKKD